MNFASQNPLLSLHMYIHTYLAFKRCNLHSCSIHKHACCSNCLAYTRSILDLPGMAITMIHRCIKLEKRRFCGNFLFKVILFRQIFHIHLKGCFKKIKFEANCKIIYQINLSYKFFSLRIMFDTLFGFGPQNQLNSVAMLKTELKSVFLKFTLFN